MCLEWDAFYLFSVIVHVDGESTVKIKQGYSPALVDILIKLITVEIHEDEIGRTDVCGLFFT